MKIEDVVMQALKGTTFMTMDTTTIVTCRKTMPEDRKMSNPHYNSVVKHGLGHRVMLFQNLHSSGYDNMVKRRLIAEGKDPSSFELGPRKWGVRVTGTPFIKHNGKTYMEAIFLGAGRTHYTYRGESIDRRHIIGEQSGSEGEQGGLDNKVIIRTFSLDSIRRITINKQTYNF